MDNCIIYKCSRAVFKYLPADYKLLVMTIDYKMMALKILFEPGRKTNLGAVKETIKNIDAENAQSKKTGYVTITVGDLIVISNYSHLEHVNILLNSPDKFYQDVKVGVMRTLAKKSTIADNYSSIMNMEDISEVQDFIHQKSISEEIGNNLLFLYTFTKEYQNNDSLTKQKPHL